MRNFFFALLLLILSHAYGFAPKPTPLSELRSLNHTIFGIDPLNEITISYWDPFGIAELELLLEADQFIPFNVNPHWVRSEESISHIGLTQEAFVFVLHYNPSYFKEERFCPGNDLQGKPIYKRVTFFEDDGPNRKEVQVEMCRTYPVDQVTTISHGKKDSDEEFLTAANKMFEAAGVPTRYRRALPSEFIWFDTQGGTLRWNQSYRDLWKVATHSGISDLDPTKDPALSIRQPSGEKQSFDVKSKLPIAIYTLSDGSIRGFWRNGGVWEWTAKTRHGNSSVLVGGSWKSDARGATPGFQYTVFSTHRDADVGASRLVRTRKDILVKQAAPNEVLVPFAGWVPLVQ